ncbi:AAA family ATPase [Scytonema sp. PCC 10023]|uniref:AAA family ATPase n=1 Tax=Scytonema sp. PCC 10023 TaxID=1680591 RepID=UPI0039C71999
MNINRYQGKGLPPDGDPNNRFPYRADPELVKAVNMAIVLKRPLLVKGVPGCGKTRLAKAIAHELGLQDNFYEWYVKSTSRAKDGLYTIDVVRRLQDAQMQNSKAQKLTPYIRFGPLGEALRSKNECVLLIDEIDKADIDFPNDLLRELDEKKFTIEELDESELSDDDRKAGYQKTYLAERSPIIVITSNDEKELPDAFLRRCLFYYIDFPEDEQLREIVHLNTADLKLNSRLVERAVERLKEIRTIEGFRKQPATSELIDWVRILYHWGIDIKALDKNKKLTDLPHWQVLFKHEQDLKQLARQAQESAV